MNLADYLSEQASRQPSGLAVLRGRNALSFGTLDRLVWNFAGWLRREGVAPGDVVGLTFPDEIRHLIAALALIRTGAVQVVLPVGDPIALRNEIAERTGVALILSGSVLPGTEKPVLVADFNRLAASHEPPDFAARSGNLSSPFLLAVGSGTTGRRKLTLHTARQYLDRWAAGCQAGEFHRGERFLAFSPIDFVSIKRRRIACALFGVTNIFSDQAENLATACDRLQADHLRLVAKQAERLLRGLDPHAPRLRLPHLRSLSMGSAVIPEPLRKSVRTRLSDKFVVAYATTETGPVAAADAEIQERHPGSVGPPAKGVTIEVVDEAGRLLPAGEVGEIRLRSPGMISGYVDDPEATARAFRDGWFYPRDLGSMTEDGVLIHHGRADDMMILDGINIFPREIELTLESHPAVAEALAFPLPHPVHQDMPAAAVVLKGQASPAELIAFCRTRLGVRAPWRVMILAEFPEGARDKGLKSELARLLHQADPSAADLGM